MIFSKNLNNSALLPSSGKKRWMHCYLLTKIRIFLKYFIFSCSATYENSLSYKFPNFYYFSAPKIVWTFVIITISLKIYSLASKYIVLACISEIKTLFYLKAYPKKASSLTFFSSSSNFFIRSLLKLFISWKQWWQCVTAS